MYHPQTTDQIRRHRQSWLRIVAAVLLTVALSLAFFMAARVVMREQGALSTRTAILDSAKQCCAVEGAYPRSITYLIDHYGLVVNDVDYQINYECYADNIVPSVVVVPR